MSSRLTFILRNSAVAVALALWLVALPAWSGHAPPAWSADAEIAWTLTGEDCPGGDDFNAVLNTPSAVLVGTDAGLFAHDGLRWTATAVDDTVRWLAEVDDSVWAGGATGVWRRSSSTEPFRKMPGGPTGVRCGLVVQDTTGTTTVWLGSDNGLHVWRDGQWQQAVSGSSIRCLVQHPDRGLLAGSHGDGLYLVANNGQIRHVLAPFAGVQDSLAGNFIHDIQVARDGSVYLATSWEDLSPRYAAYQNAVHQGLISPKDGDSFLRSALCRWSDSGWEITYLHQNYNRDVQHLLLDKWVLYSGDCDRDGQVEIILVSKLQRELHPQGMACFDAATGQLEWSIESAGPPFSLVPLQTPKDEPLRFLSFLWPHDFGSIYRNTRDDSARLQVIDGKGTVLRDFDLEAPLATLFVPIHSYLREEPCHDPIYFYTFHDQNTLTAAGRFDPRSLSFESVPLPDFPAANRLVVAPYLPVASGDLAVFPDAKYDVNGLFFLTALDRGHCLQTLDASPLLPRQPDGKYQAAFALQLEDERSWTIWMGVGSTPLVRWSSRGVRSVPVRFDPPWDSPSSLSRSIGPGWTLTHRDLDGRRLRVYRRLGDGPLRAHDKPVGPGFLPAYAVPVLPSDESDSMSFRLAADLPLTSTFLRARPEDFPYWLYSNPRTGRKEWLEASAVEGSLLVRDDRGEVRSHIALPPDFADSAGLTWLTGGTPVKLHGHDCAVLCNLTSFPYTSILFDPVTRSWGPRYAWPNHFVDLHASALTAIDPHDGWLGTERGIRAWNPPASAESGEDILLPHLRTRGFVRPPGHGTWVFGRGGLLEFDRAPTVVQQDVSAVTRCEDGLLAAAHDSLLFFSKDGARSSLKYLPIPVDLKHTRLQLGSADDGTTWYQFTEPTWVGSSAHLMRERPDRWPKLHNGLFHEGALWAVFDLRRISKKRYLVATERSVFITDLDRDSTLELFNSSVRARAILPVDEKQWLVSTVDGPVYRISASGDSFRVALADSTRGPETAILDWDVEGGRVWTLTPSTVSCRFGDGSEWKHALPDDSEVSVMEPVGDGSAWLILSHRLWRASPVGVFPTSLPGIPAEKITGIVDGRGVAWPDTAWPDTTGSAHDGRKRSFYVLADRVLYEVEHRKVQELQTRAIVEGDTLLTVAWSDGPLRTVAMAVRDTRSEDEYRLLPTTPTHGPALKAFLAKPARGRQRIEVLAIDAMGLAAGEPMVLRRVIREASLSVILATALLPPLLLLLWIVEMKWPWRRIALSLAATAVVLLAIHQLLLFQVRWDLSAAGTGLALVAGVSIRRRRQARTVDPQVAIEGLYDALKAFRHRGSSSNPVDDLLLFSRHAEALSENEEDLLEKVRSTAHDILSATDELERSGRTLVPATGLDPLLLRQLFLHLEELRMASLQLVEAAEARELWLKSLDHRRAITDICRGFLQSTERVAELLRSYRPVEATAFLRTYATALHSRHAHLVHLSLPEQPCPLPLLQRELEEILDNLVRNAASVIPEGSELELWISVAELGESCELSVEDNGPGVPAEVIDRIFDEGFSTRGSTGFGLHRCRQLLSARGGSITCRKGTQRGGACFVIQLPAGTKPQH